MAAILSQSSSKFSEPKMSPLKQHPISPALRSNSSDATQTIFLNHPSARLSSSPASSPRIIESIPVRRGSVHPAMSETMEKGLEPGADFFDDGSSDSAWEDSEGDVTQTFSDVKGLRFGGSSDGMDEEHGLRGRSRERSVVTALPPLPSHDSGLGIEEEHLSSPIDGSGTKKAREMSLKRLGKDKVRLVHTLSTSGTPRGSLRSNDSDNTLPLIDLPKPFPNLKPNKESAGFPRSHSFKGRHRRNTSESVIADSIIDAHVMTMRALESLSPSRSLSFSTSRIPKSTSITHDRHITLVPLPAAEHDRPPNLPNHFIKTPYPFTTKKEFPKPNSCPRRHGVDSDHKRVTTDDTRPDSGSEEENKLAYSDRKGKHILGMLMPSEGEYDLRGRLERNRDAQGVVRSTTGSEREQAESVVWLSLQRGKRKRNHSNGGKRLFRVDIPSTLTTSSPDRSTKGVHRSVEIDFDDKFLAKQLRAGYRSLAGNWLARTFSARTLSSIQLARSSTWSGSIAQDNACAVSGLLVSGDGLPGAVADNKPPFTEVALTSLYKKPAMGKARYIWVHWARRVAASNRCTLPQSSLCGQHTSRRRAYSLDSPQKHAGTQTSKPHPNSSLSSDLPSYPTPCPSPDSITTIHFTLSLSPTRVLAALSLMLVVSLVAALLWVFVGASGTGWRTGVERERSDRVGSGMAVGVLVLLFEGVGFGAWVWIS